MFAVLIPPATSLVLVTPGRPTHPDILCWDLLGGVVIVLKSMQSDASVGAKLASDSDIIEPETKKFITPRIVAEIS